MRNYDAIERYFNVLERDVSGSVKGKGVVKGVGKGGGESGGEVGVDDFFRAPSVAKGWRESIKEMIKSAFRSQR
jgi:hypothetical protein